MKIVILKYTLNDAKELNDSNNTISKILKNHFKLSSRLITKLKKLDEIYLNNINISKLKHYINEPIKLHDTILVNLDYPEDNSNIITTKMDLNILYEDNYLLAINKPAGIAVHPTMDHYTDTLSNGVKYYFDKIGLHKSLRIINRLDKKTSGIVLFAKNEYIQEELIREMNLNKGNAKEMIRKEFEDKDKTEPFYSAKSFQKTYLAIVWGTLNKKQGLLNFPISRKPNSIIERCVDLKNGKSALTQYTVLQEFKLRSNEIGNALSSNFLSSNASHSINSYSLVEINLLTGRTHQIRVHFSYIGHPLVGDTLYGYTNLDPQELINRQALHCYKLAFTHPITKKRLEILAPIPDDMQKLLN